MSEHDGDVDKLLELLKSMAPERQEVTHESKLSELKNSGRNDITADEVADAMKNDVIGLRTTGPHHAMLLDTIGKLLNQPGSFRIGESIEPMQPDTIGRLDVEKRALDDMIRAHGDPEHRMFKVPIAQAAAVAGVLLMIIDVIMAVLPRQTSGYLGVVISGLINAIKVKEHDTEISMALDGLRVSQDDGLIAAMCRLRANRLAHGFNEDSVLELVRDSDMSTYMKLRALQDTFIEWAMSHEAVGPMLGEYMDEFEKQANERL